MADTELARTFNCGIGMAVIAEPGAADGVAETLRAAGETVHPIGVIEEAATGSQDTVIAGMETAWHG